MRGGEELKQSTHTNKQRTHDKRVNTQDPRAIRARLRWGGCPRRTWGPPLQAGAQSMHARQAREARAVSSTREWCFHTRTENGAPPHARAKKRKEHTRKGRRCDVERESEGPRAIHPLGMKPFLRKQIRERAHRDHSAGGPPGAAARTRSGAEKDHKSEYVSM